MKAQGGATFELQIGESLKLQSGDFTPVLKVERTDLEKSMQALMEEMSKLREEIKSLRESKKQLT